MLGTVIDNLKYHLGSIEGIGLFVLIFFIGIGFGWFFKKRHIGWMIFLGFLGVMIFVPVLEILIKFDHWYLSLPFMVGALVHPIHSRIKTR